MTSQTERAVVDPFVMWSFKDDELPSYVAVADQEEKSAQKSAAVDSAPAMDTEMGIFHHGSGQQDDRQTHNRSVRFNKFLLETDCEIHDEDIDDEDDGSVGAYFGLDNNQQEVTEKANSLTHPKQEVTTAGEYYHPLLLSTRRREYLDVRTYTELINDHPTLPIILVDVQFVGNEVVEIAVVTPQMPMAFHDIYPMCMIHDRKRPVSILTGVQVPPTDYHRKQNNKNTINVNMSYVRMNCCNGYNRNHNSPLRDNKTFFQSLPPFAVYVLRGHNKHLYWEELLKTYGKNGKIVIFAESFFKPGHRQTQTNCLAHEHSNAACSLANVRKMSKYYNHCSYMFT